MIDQTKILFTGGSGLLGGEVRKLLPNACFPSSRDFDVTRPDQMDSFLRNRGFQTLIHAAAFTSPPKVDQNPLKALDVNIVGTSNVVRVCMAHGLKLIYLSTDYVFPGDKGHYKETDPVCPVNKYAWSKLGGECAVRMYDRSLIVRTSFGPNEFPYEKAFVDQWTSRENVSAIAAKIVRLLEVDVTGVIHLGAARRTVMEYARTISPHKNIQELSIKDVKFAVPVDTSLDCERYTKLTSGACREGKRS